LAGVVAYGLFNTAYYTVAFLVVWFTVVKAPAGGRCGAEASRNWGHPAKLGSLEPSSHLICSQYDCAASFRYRPVNSERVEG
jgi:hypothetical protein